MVVCALPPEKGASPREESRQRGYRREGGGGERTKGGIAGRGVGTKRERRLATLRWKGNGQGGGEFCNPERSSTTKIVVAA
ncbi:unnamed protein product [Lasius platythorax]|uniref:Uncharacterized protein n=1 Tax=Lasius platythorax TaxID=488582 RepID=A0AAV2P2V0_9HYME